jgi:hypothetical protein
LSTVFGFFLIGLVNGFGRRWHTVFRLLPW